MRRLLIGLFALFVVAAASGSGSCNGNYNLPIYGPVVLNPTSLTWNCPSFAPQPFTATQSNYTGTFTAQSQNTSVATVSATSPPGTFSVAPGPGGTTSIVVTGGNGIASSLTVTINACPCVRHKDMWLQPRAARVRK